MTSKTSKTAGHNQIVSTNPSPRLGAFLLSLGSIFKEVSCSEVLRLTVTINLESNRAVPISHLTKIFGRGINDGNLINNLLASAIYETRPSAQALHRLTTLCASGGRDEGATSRTSVTEYFCSLSIRMFTLESLYLIFTAKT